MSQLSALVKRVVCPKCRGPLLHRDDENALDCDTCGLRYPIEDGIPVLMTDRAAPIATGRTTS